MEFTPPPPGAASDWTIPQDWGRFTEGEHAVWDMLFARQTALLQDRASRHFLAGIDVLRLTKPGIPDFAELSERLMGLTGWQVVAVPGLIPDDIFYEHLANRRFPAGNFIRKPDQLDFIEEPDVFHDLFGHVPLLSNPVFADYMQAYGHGGLRAMEYDAVDKLARLYWYTVEFALIVEDGRLRILGAGVSSFAESHFALDDPSPNRLGFDLERILRTRYRVDDFQQTYFVMDSIEQLLRTTLDTDFGPLYERLRALPDYPVETVLPTDKVFTHGTQAYARSKAA